MNGKRLIGLILVFCMVIGAVPIGARAAGTGWYWDEDILYVRSTGIINLYDAIVEKCAATSIYEVKYHTGELTRSNASTDGTTITSVMNGIKLQEQKYYCLLYTSPSPRD